MPVPSFDTIKTAALKVMIGGQSDLYIDAQCIDENPGVPFLHFTRDTGTYLVFLPPFEKLPARGRYVTRLFGTINRDDVVDNIANMIGYCAIPQNNLSLLVHHCDGVNVRKITMKKSIEIAKQHVCKLREQIRKDSR